jgi:hypothetical protein
MAFFGLTALGPQSVFASNYKHAFTLDLFDISGNMPVRLPCLKHSNHKAGAD